MKGAYLREREERKEGQLHEERDAETPEESTGRALREESMSLLVPPREIFRHEQERDKEGEVEEEEQFELIVEEKGGVG